MMVDMKVDDEPVSYTHLVRIQVYGLEVAFFTLSSSVNTAAVHGVSWETRTRCDQLQQAESEPLRIAK